MHYALQSSFIPSKDYGFKLSRTYQSVEKDTDVIVEKEQGENDQNNNNNNNKNNKNADER